MGGTITIAKLFDAFDKADEKRIIKLVRKIKIIELNYVCRDTTALIHIASSGNINILQAILERKGVDINNKDKAGDTALIAATRKGFHKCVDELAKYGADVNAKDKEGLTALFIAANNTLPEVARVLLARNADATIRDVNGRPALHHAATRGDAATISAMLDKGANPNLELEDGTTPLFWARTEAGVKALLDGKANVNHQKKNGETRMFDAVQMGNEDVVKLLLLQGSDVNIKNTKGQTVFEKLAGYGEVENLRRLIDKLDHRRAKQKDQDDAKAKTDADAKSPSKTAAAEAPKAS